MISRKLLWSIPVLFYLCSSTGAAQERKPRDLNRYTIGDRFELTWGLGQAGLERVRQKARDYLWEQWQRKQLTYFMVSDCVIYPEGCDDSIEYKIYVEPNEKGQWLVVIEPEYVESAFMSGKDKEQRSPGERSVYSAVKKLAAGENSGCFTLFTERSEEPSQFARLRLTSGESGIDDRTKRCIYF